MRLIAEKYRNKVKKFRNAWFSRGRSHISTAPEELNSLHKSSPSYFEYF